MSRAVFSVCRSSSGRKACLVALGAVVVLGGLAVSRPARSNGLTLTRPSRSTTIALTNDGTRIVVANRETNSVSVIQVGRVEFLFGIIPFLVDVDPPVKLGEVSVGPEPRCVAVSPNDGEAYVTSSGNGTVSVISLADTPNVVAEIAVGTELRGCALTPNASRLYVADFTGKVFEISPQLRTILRVHDVGGNPEAIAITNNGDPIDVDETVFVEESEEAAREAAGEKDSTTASGASSCRSWSDPPHLPYGSTCSPWLTPASPPIARTSVPTSIPPPSTTRSARTPRRRPAVPSSSKTRRACSPISWARS